MEKMETVRIIVKVTAGQCISDAIKDAKSLMWANKIPVTFDFNGVDVTVWHRDQPDSELIEEYHRKLHKGSSA